MPGRKRSEARNLLERLRDRQQEYPRFTWDPSVAPTDNQGERDLRPVKTQMKISGCHQSETGAANWLAVRSSLSTAVKHGHSAYTALRAAMTCHHGCKIHLIVDQHPTHKATTIKNWLAEHRDEIEQHFLPGYSPELNPAELLNGDTKKHIATHTGARTRRGLASMITAHLHRRRKQPTLLAALFHKPEAAYAAA